MTPHVRFALAGVLAGISLVCAGAPVAPTSGSVFKSTSTSVFVQWTGGGPEYRIVSKPGTTAPASDSDGTVLEVGAATSAHVTRLRTPTSLPPEGYPAQPVTIAIYARENGVSSPTALVIPASIQASGNTSTGRFVDAASGVDAGNCSLSAAPCRTISYGMAWAGWDPLRGERLTVAPGTYNLAHGEYFPLEMIGGVQMVSSHGPEATVIDATGSLRRVMNVVTGYPFGSIGPAATSVTGFTFRGGRALGSSNSVIAAGGALWLDGFSTTIARNLFEGNEARGWEGTAANTSGGEARGGAIFITPATYAVRINDNQFRGNAARGGGGVVVDGQPCCKPRGSGGYAGAIYAAVGTWVAPGGSQPLAGAVIERDTFHGNAALGGSGDWGGSAAAGALFADNADVRDNIFTSNQADAGPAATSVNGAISYAFTSGTASADSFTRNLYFGNTAAGAPSDGNTTGSAAILADPRYIAPPLNLRIPILSPAASTSTTGASGVDFDGHVRFTPPSRGAFEAREPPSAGLVGGDLDGFGRSSLVFLNDFDGRVFRVGYAAGGAQNAANTVWNESDPLWRIVEMGDFNGDGVSDLVWRHWPSGDFAILFFGDGGIAAASRSSFYNEQRDEWKIVGTPDFDGDGNSDLLWHNDLTGQAWGMQMNGSTIVSQGPVYHEPNLDWRVVAVGSPAGGYRRNQVLWRNAATGHVYLQTVHLSGGVFSTTGQMIYDEPDTAWSIAGTGDFDGDGKTDILWRNKVSGDVHMMLMNGPAIASQATFYREANPAWVIVANGDYDGDGKADILWRNEQSGQVYRQRMNGTTIVDQGFVFHEPNTIWMLMGPATFPR